MARCLGRKILARRRPISELVRDSRIATIVRHKLQVVSPRRIPGIHQLRTKERLRLIGLDKRSSCGSLRAYRDKLEPYTWWFTP